MPAILIHALAVHAAGHLTLLRASRSMPSLAAGDLRSRLPAGPAWALTPPRSGTPSWAGGKWGVLICGVVRPAAVRREDGDRPPEVPGVPGRRRRGQASCGCSAGLSLVAASAGIVAVFL